MISMNSVLTCFQIIITGDYYFNISTASFLNSSLKAYEMKDFCLRKNLNSERIQWMSKFDVSDLHLKLSDEFNFDPLLCLLRRLSFFFNDVMSWAVKPVTTVRIHCIVCNLFLNLFTVLKNSLVFFRLCYAISLLNFVFINLYIFLMIVFSVLSKYLNSMPVYSAAVSICTYVSHLC